VAGDCITADGLASAVSVLGPQAGLRLVEETSGAAARILYIQDGKLIAYQSRRFRQLATADR
jgi:thiamine biosynthesis lipoprotein